jgi:uncharacterized membrane protein
MTNKRKIIISVSLAVAVLIGCFALQASYVKRQLSEGDAAYRNMLNPESKANKDFAASVAEATKAYEPITKGSELMRQGKVEEALIEFAKYSDDSERHSAIAEGYEAIGRYEDALKEIDWLIAHANTDWYKQHAREWAEKVRAKQATAAPAVK